MNILFTIVCIIWGLSEILLNRLLRSKAEDLQNEDRNSLRMIWMTILISTSFAILITQRSSFPIINNNVIFYIGLAIILSGVILRLLVIRSMGAMFTVDVTIRKEHKLKTDGFFKIVRHPSYFASLLSFIGFGLSLNNWLSLAVVFIMIFMAFSRRIQIEENVLINQFGDAYLDYKKRTKRIIPFIY
ncbi:isoprenylcysteine carboxylmethyltransferase family protein [Taibaiella lutea]|uniref:Isoprenylcysteine carboxylmethyltransferase family protein n=1 Tax=Taibaiella lutea TaxID=2608001 RepID=A0A5M6CU16_9BACT|nr:isoprenylcysteine carboxylmethyltransferase family protein [Taibaiella lutea]KAA5536495.1 isoprenylcysteine carboxylmethyltransferase family protein [Taibaiella lutea]